MQLPFQHAVVGTMIFDTHSYAVLKGTERASVGRLLGLLAGILSTMAVALIELSTSVFESLGLPYAITPTVFALTSAAVFYQILFWIFDKWAWKLKFIQSLICWPCVEGVWNVQGRTSPEKGGYEWLGILTIKQTWSEISVILRTTQSSSCSSAATIAIEPDGRLRVLYNYGNQPHPLQVELNIHQGFGDILFDSKKETGLAFYHNGRGRDTFGEMELTMRCS